MNAIHIQRFCFRGRETHRRQVVADLDRVAWPALQEREYLFIKQLQAHQSAGQLASSLAEQAYAYRCTAVNGWLANAESENAVYFASYAELLACLSRDLLQKKRCWYWLQWADLFDQTIATALMKCWYQQQNLIPAIVAQLAQHNELPWFCRQLSETMAEQLCRAVCPQLNLAKRAHQAANDDCKDIHIPSHWLSPWQPVFIGASLPVQVMQLAALIILREWQPLKWLQDDVMSVFGAILLQLAALSENEPQASVDAPVSRTADTPVSRSNMPSAVIERSNSETPPGLDAVQELPITAGKTVSAAEEAAQILAKQRLAIDKLNPATTNARPALEKTLSQIKPGISDMDKAEAMQNTVQVAAQTNAGLAYPPRCPTQQGGIFYLLNFLNLQHVQQSLLSDPVSQHYPSAWGWLWQLANSMGWEPDQSLLQLFALFCGYAEAEELSQLPALPQMDNLLLWGRQRYGEELFNKDVFSVDALIEIDASHVDVFYALDSIRLDVRRVGLDIDPGWLPWLGKVVKFHYGPLPVL